MASVPVCVLHQRDLLSTEVENSGGVDSCLQFLDETAGRWPTALALSLLSLALDCATSRPRNRPRMENVSIRGSFFNFRNRNTLCVTKYS